LQFISKQGGSNAKKSAHCGRTASQTEGEEGKGSAQQSRREARGRDEARSCREGKAQAEEVIGTGPASWLRAPVMFQTMLPHSVRLRQYRQAKFGFVTCPKHSAVHVRFEYCEQGRLKGESFGCPICVHLIRLEIGYLLAHSRRSPNRTA
jgi:hypothetical protein